MANVFQQAACRAFAECMVKYVGATNPGSDSMHLIAQLHDDFREKLEASCKAFDACTTADKLEEHLLTQRAERAAAELLRAWNARKDVAYAMERYWATFNPPKPPRLF